ncbi:uncharacterized protein LOC125757120 [Rhipicephalus sanguineus]|uniref:uncharacterized protein LOC125757120 n=1 Tax=Rhipicephalus sanguineus TaxID=34632 RepID=UPI0020C4734A|nr:uncharacterized protein LOC125757120 [Rhipicephalus sanguineus]
MRKFSAVAFGTSAAVLALYVGVVIGMTAWHDNHQDTGIIVDEPNSNEGVDAGSQGSQGGRASLPPKSPGDSFANEEDRKSVAATVTLHTPKRKKLASTRGGDDYVPRATVGADDVASFESSEGRGKRHKTKPKRTPKLLTDDLYVEPTGTATYVRKMYIPRRRSSTSSGTTVGFNSETSSDDEPRLTSKRRPSTHQRDTDDVTANDVPSTVSETADFSPETDSKKTKTRRLFVAAPTSDVTTDAEPTSPAQARREGPPELTGNDSNASTIAGNKMTTGLKAARKVGKVGTTVTPSIRTKHDTTRKGTTELTAKARSIRSGQQTPRTPAVTGATVPGRKIIGAGQRQNSTHAVTGLTVQGRKILTASNSRDPTPAVTGRTMQGRKILGADKRNNWTVAAPTMKGRKILGASRNNSRQDTNARTVKAYSINRNGAFSKAL